MKQLFFAARRNPPSNRQGDERAGEIHGYTVAEQRYPWAAAPQAGLQLLFLIAKVIALPQNKLLVGRRDKGGNLPVKFLCAAPSQAAIPATYPISA